MTGYYLIIRGPPAVGKTEVADQLRATLKGKTVHIDIDKLRMMPYRAGGSPEEKRLANRNAISLCQNFVESGYRVILEELFYEKELVEEVEQALPYPHTKFFLKASLETCLERNFGREYQLKAEQMERLYHQVNSLSLPEEVIIITDNKKIEDIVNEIMGYLPQTVQRKQFCS